MSETKKIAISLPGELVEKVEKIRSKTGETRSAFIRGAIERALSAWEHRVMIARYQEGYRDQPETPEEVEAAGVAASMLFAEEPWE